MRRGHVPPVEAGKVHAVVNSAGKKSGHFASMHSRKVGLCLCLFWSDRRRDPVPALLATHRGAQKLDFVEQFL